MPGVPGAVQRRDLEKVCKTYGKTFHFWQVDKGDTLPLGLPQVMYAFTRDGQLDDNLVQGKWFDLNYSRCGEEIWSVHCAERENRTYMTGQDHGVHPLANGSGKGLKTELRETDFPSTDPIPTVFV
ncbi:hypothetical protein MRB53_027737 [Persea americana]|uniref:Uncharacterized protein n=1 Tax=Persea americana TaxID=3435 RepID=A0ACC2LN04_PERAE|nr:hypothetical protein MRB53_027737 [Persea americana]